MHDSVVFSGSLKELHDGVDEQEIVHQIPLSHEMPCKFFTAYWVVSGIHRNVVVVHGPEGCAFNAKELRHFNVAYCGTRYDYTGCTRVDERAVIFGGEKRLEEAILEVDRERHPDMITVLTTCSSGIIGDDVEAVVEGAGARVRCPLILVRCEGFSGDFRIGYDEAYRALLPLMRRGDRMKGFVNIIGARRGPEPVATNGELQEIVRMLEGVGLRTNAIIAGGCTVEQLAQASRVELNVAWCTDLGTRMGRLMEQEFGVPYAASGMPYGLAATRDFLREIGELTGRRADVERFIASEEARVTPALEETRRLVAGKTAIISLGPVRSIHLSRMLAEDLGMRVVIHNLHPYQIKERRAVIDYFLSKGINPRVVVTRGAFTFGAYESLAQDERELRELAAADPGSVLYFGSAYAFPGVPLINIDNQESFPHVGFRGVERICTYTARGLERYGRPRSRLFRRVMYGE